MKRGPAVYDQPRYEVRRPTAAAGRPAAQIREPDAGPTLGARVTDDPIVGPFGHGDIEPSVVGTVTFSGYTMACTAPDGSIAGPGRPGLYDYDTRILSRYEWRLNGEALSLVSATTPDPSRRVVTLTCAREGGTPDGPRLPRDAFELTLTRRVGRGMLDEVDLRNHSMVGADVELTLVLDADFVEALARESDQREVGRVTTSWHPDAQMLEFRFSARHDGRVVERGSRIAVLPGSQRAHRRGKSLVFRFALPPRGQGRVRLAIESCVDGVWRSPLTLGSDAMSPTSRDADLEAWRAARTHLQAAEPAGESFEQAADDLHALRLWELDGLAQRRTGRTGRTPRRPMHGFLRPARRSTRASSGGTC